MGAGNVLVLRETFEAFKNVCDEIVYGDLLIFPEDRMILHTYEKEYNLKIVEFRWNYIYKNGFASILNELSARCTNDMVLYMNTSEAIDEDYGIVDLVNQNKDCNSFYFIHREDKHRWFRMNNRKQLKWSGLIHEEVIGEQIPYHKPIFMMKDLEKDLFNPYKAKVLNDLKEAVYFTQYNRIAYDHTVLGATNTGWVGFAKENYESMAYRLRKKGDRIRALEEDDLWAYLDSTMKDPLFHEEEFKSSNAIEFQGSPMFLGKK